MLSLPELLAGFVFGMAFFYFGLSFITAMRNTTFTFPRALPDFGQKLRWFLNR